MCDWGNDTTLVVPVPAELSHNGQLYWKSVGIDSCIAPIVRALNNGGVYTSQSCCGHGKGDGIITLHDGRTLIIKHDP